MGGMTGLEVRSRHTIQNGWVRQLHLVSEHDDYLMTWYPTRGELIIEIGGVIRQTRHTPEWKWMQKPLKRHFVKVPVRHRNSNAALAFWKALQANPYRYLVLDIL